MQSYILRENHGPYADGHGTPPTTPHRATAPLLSVGSDTDAVSDHTDTLAADTAVTVFHHPCQRGDRR
jgi:hypothetical protein